MKELADDFGGRGHDRHGDIESLEFNAQSFVVDPAQVFVAGQQDGAAQQGRFRRDEGIMDFRFGQEARFAQPMGDAFGDAMTDGHEIDELESSHPVLLEKADGRGAFLRGIAQIGGVGQFRCDRGRNAQRALAKP